MNELISVILPVYNAEHFLERCLNSLLSQTYKNLEIIVVNDGSTDNSTDIINSFALKDERIVTIHISNKGVSNARNQGLKRATGDFIGFVDADDEVLPEMYEILLKNALENNAEISHCGFELVNPNSIVKFHGTGDFCIQNKHQGVNEILSGNRVEPSVCNKIYKKHLVENLEFPTDIKVNEDLLFNIKAFYIAETSVFQDIVLYRYIHNGESASRSTFSIKKAQDIYEVAKSIKSIIKDKELQFSVNRFYVLKLLTILQELKQNNLYQTTFAKELRNEVAKIKTKNMGNRIIITQILMIKFPMFYSLSRFFYDLFFMKNQKWKNH